MICTQSTIRHSTTKWTKATEKSITMKMQAKKSEPKKNKNKKKMREDCKWNMRYWCAACIRWKNAVSIDVCVYAAAYERMDICSIDRTAFDFSIFNPLRVCMFEVWSLIIIIIIIGIGKQKANSRKTSSVNRNWSETTIQHGKKGRHTHTNTSHM